MQQVKTASPSSKTPEHAKQQGLCQTKLGLIRCKGEKMVQKLLSDTKLLTDLWFYFIWWSCYFLHQTSLCHLCLAYDLHQYSVDKGALRPKLDTEFLDILLK